MKAPGDRRPEGEYENVRPAGGKDDPSLDPFEISFREEELRESRGPRDPFVNEFGVVIGDHDYESERSPLESWSEETDPSDLSGGQWVHPYRDIGFLTQENRDWFERGISSSRPFMHPAHSTAPSAEFGEEDGFPAPEAMDEP